jgi:hypothetical protein
LASSRIIGYVDKFPVVDLFPYKIKDVNKFIFRDHVPYNEDNPVSVDYAQDQWVKIIEGHWVFDFEEGKEEEGTWVYMMPNLYDYINFGTVTIRDETGQYDGPPECSDIEWIYGSYSLCFDGFSGFTDDPDYTCNLDILKLEQGKTLTPYEYERLDNQFVRKSDGTYKKYVEAWEYLTNYYLVENPRTFPLGKPLYFNGSFNGMVLASRKARKTYFFAGGDFVHEFKTNGVKDAKYLSRKNTISLFAAASDKNFLSTFMQVAEKSWRVTAAREKDSVSPFFVDAEGKWDAERAKIIQGYRPIGSSEIIGSGTDISNAIIMPKKAEIVVSKRCRRINVDEIGLVKNSKAVQVASEGTLKAGGKPIGSLVMTGTGGNIEAIQETKEIAEDPKTYRVYPVPNYWAGDKPFCLFVPVAYTEVKYKDKNGNTDLMKATRGILDDWIEETGGDLSKIIEKRQNFPHTPAEMFLAGKSDYFAKEILTDRIEVLDQGGLWKAKAQLFDLELGVKKSDGTFEVRAVEHFRYDNVIKTIFPRDNEGKTGELVVYEPPKHNPTPFAQQGNIYKCILDPVSDKDTGRSYQALIVYKGYPNRALEPYEIVNNIVAVCKWRRDDETNKKQAMLLCLWYQCCMQYENNTPGTHAFFYKHGLVRLLQPPPWSVIKEVAPNTVINANTGVTMNHILKGGMLKEFKAFHKSIKRRDDSGREFTWIEDCPDISLLYEMNFFDGETNVDLISAMLILMMWLQEEYKPDLPVDNSAPREDFNDLYEISLQQTSWY